MFLSNGVIAPWTPIPMSTSTPATIKVRNNGAVMDMAALAAIGVSDTGMRQILGASVALSEQITHRRDFLRHLQKRNLHGVKLLISDVHEGLKAARKAVFPSIPWQRCQFHLQQNVQAYVPRQELNKAFPLTSEAFLMPPRRTRQKGCSPSFWIATKNRPRAWWPGGLGGGKHPGGTGCL